MNINFYTEQVQNWIKEISTDSAYDPQAVIKICDQLEDYGKRNSDDALIGFARFSRGEAYYMLYDVKNFYQQMFACIAPMERIEEWGYVAMANNLLGIICLDSGNPSFAIDYYQRALNICEKYQLPDIESTVRMNIGNLYLLIGENEQALACFKHVYSHMTKQYENEQLLQNLTAINLQMAKAYLCLGMEEEAQKYLENITEHYLSQASEVERFVVNCFLCVYYYQTNQAEAFQESIYAISEAQVKYAPIMDVYDDLYDYLEVLLRAKEYKYFYKIYMQTKALARQTSIKNFEKRLLNLELQYYKQQGLLDRYRDVAVFYYELAEKMEEENNTLMASVVKMRMSLNSLEQKNKEVTKRNKDLRIKSETDALTGIYNRAKLMEYGKVAFSRAQKNQTSIAVEMLDIDYFKQYNDNYGHQAGDVAITTVAKEMLSLEREMQDHILCARYGGDEFVIIYENLTMKEVETLANELKEKIEAQKVEHKYSSVGKYLTISQGICWGIPESGQIVEDYLRQADRNLYEVKKESRNSVRVGEL